jgi:hypothetical protein
VSAIRGVRFGAAIAVAAVAAFLVWYFAIRDTGNDSGGGPRNLVGPVAATETDVADLASKSGQPIYWAGNQPGTTDLELTETADKNIYVRYLTGNAPINTRKPNYLTVGTYPFPDAYHAITVIAKRPGAKTFNLSNGGLAVQNTNSPDSVYLAYPDHDYQIEVYDPDSAEARRLVTTGAIEPIR